MNDDAAPNLTSGDLSFLKSLVSEGPRAQATAGQVFMIAGLLYGVQCLLNWLGVAFKLDWSPPVWLLVGFGPTALFLLALAVIIWRDRRNRVEGVAARALNATYTSAGLANLFVVAIFGYNAIQEKSMTLWLLYPAVICVFQGAVWYVAWVIRRKLWLAVISAGWFLTSLALGALIHNAPDYLLVLSVALIVLMGGGGWYMQRTAQK
ncbi:MAG: hypothetical protein ACTHLA_15585 [Asticcacaulis sp.]|uniref:hypothetical protein n=1 Tax=Asticcacaulis sp. TaxID=1872648 RepID=UPI003F7BF990